MSNHVMNLPRLSGGTVHLPGETGYDERRGSLNPAVDAHPVMVIEAAGAADVRTAVLTAGDCGLALAVQATGHGTHTAAEGILLRTTRMDSVRIDPLRRTATVGPGTRWGQVLDEARKYGLAPLSGSSRDVGVTGFTLGGGVGWLSRRYGFAADSVLSAQVVLSDGRQVRASGDENTDLFWALRGGGGSFGVVTSLEFQLYPVREVQAGVVTLDRETALATYRKLTENAPDALSTALMITPDSVFMKVLYAGGAAEAERLVGPGLTTMEYADAAMGGTPARYLDFYHDLPDEALMRTGSRATVEIRHWGGAMANPGGPAGHRDVPYSVIVNEVTEDMPRGVGATFLNFLADPSRIHTAFTADAFRRLADVKRAYDPTGMFGPR